MSDSTTSRTRDILKRQWFWVLIPTIIGVGVALALSGGQSPVTWVATQRLAVYPMPSSVVKDFKPAAVIAAAGTPAVLRSVEASLGLGAGTLSGAVSAKADSADPSVVVLSARAASEAEALALADAAAAATAKRALAPYTFVVATGLAEAKVYDSYVAELKARMASLDRLAATAPAAQKAALAQSQALYIQQIHEFEAKALDTRNTAGYVDATIVRVGDPAVSRSSNTRLKLGLLLQGLVAGLSIGVILAFGREWLLARSRSNV